ncbi:dipeptidase PepE [Pleionea sp. CnH1-48]|uniref:dipeptidase PepE n=1 Tax=Pleionea sp. CnH1-48 TaxID=2954494 RepID=UPI002097EEE6|nr:dipeptidase PepE [Pleionea sp. CnH1-48]MCO7226939.1 dipeptidase PepE [Pleionea sp. CnH1-48]
MSANLLLLSSSRYENGGYLEHAMVHIKEFLGPQENTLLFIPFAGVSVGYDDYEALVKKPFVDAGYNIQSIHTVDNPEQAIKDSAGIVVGGGNTFHLLHQLYQFDLLGLIREQVLKGKPYIGWSAGSNIAAPTIMTTNDMPIIQPPSFHALHLVPCQINPHYLDKHPPGFNGETRAQRLEEFLTVNPDARVIGLREGTGLKLNDDKVSLVGDHPAVIFEKDKQYELDATQDLQFLIAEDLL